MAVAYAEKSNLTPLEMLKLMRAETWFTLRKAQQIFHGIEADDMKVAASIKPEWLERFTNIPLDVAVGLHVAAGAPRPKSAEQVARRKVRQRKRKRLMLMAASQRPDPVTAKRQRQRHRLEIRAELFARKDPR